MSANIIKPRIPRILGLIGDWGMLCRRGIVEALSTLVTRCVSRGDLPLDIRPAFVHQVTPTVCLDSQQFRRWSDTARRSSWRHHVQQHA